MIAALKSKEIENCQDFRLAFVSDDAVDEQAVSMIAIGNVAPFAAAMSAQAALLLRAPAGTQATGAA